MAKIYLASSVGPGGFSKQCALKLIRPEYAQRREVTEMLVKEAQIAALLHHPNIVQVLDLGVEREAHYMAMELVEGASLGQILGLLVHQKRSLSVSACAHIGTCVGAALAYLKNVVELNGERVTLVHRDVSPSNVLVSTSGAIKLADFGIVKVLEAPTNTNIGVVKGKYAYMSPEQMRAEKIDHRSDIFALGIVLFEAMTRRRLFRRSNLALTVAAVAAAEVPPPSTLNPEVPRSLDEIVLKALAKRPDDRFQDAIEIVEALAPFVGPSAKVELGRLAQDAATSYDESRTRLDEALEAHDPGPTELVQTIDNRAARPLGSLGSLGPVVISDLLEDPAALPYHEPQLSAPPKEQALTPSSSGQPTPGAPTPSSWGGAGGGAGGGGWALALAIVTSLLATAIFWATVLR